MSGWPEQLAEQAPRSPRGSNLNLLSDRARPTGCRGKSAAKSEDVMTRKKTVKTANVANTANPHESVQRMRKIAAAGVLALLGLLAAHLRLCPRHVLRLRP